MVTDQPRNFRTVELSFIQVASWLQTAHGSCRDLREPGAAMLPATRSHGTDTAQHVLMIFESSVGQSQPWRRNSTVSTTAVVTISPIAHR